MTNVIPIKGAQPAPKNQRSQMETLILTPAMMETWQKPPFQRMLKVNEKVKSIADDLKRDPVIGGILTLGILASDKNGTLYLLDGQHRREAAYISGLKEFIGDVRIMIFDTMAEMAEEFVKLNTPIVKMQPDDVLRGLEPSTRPLQIIRQKCPFVGYAFIRTSGRGYQLGMSATLRCWAGSEKETPGVTGGKSALIIAGEMTIEDAEELAKILNVLMSSWGKDIENTRLWSNLNLCMCMWIWRVMVLDRDRGGGKRYATLSTDQFKHCLMALAASVDYIQFLVGRQMNDRDRSPTYRRIKMIFSDRLKHEGIDNLRFPSPSWAKN